MCVELLFDTAPHLVSSRLDGACHVINTARCLSSFSIPSTQLVSLGEQLHHPLKYASSHFILCETAAIIRGRPLSLLVGLVPGPACLSSKSPTERESQVAPYWIVDGGNLLHEALLCTSHLSTNRLTREASIRCSSIPIIDCCIRIGMLIFSV